MLFYLFNCSYVIFFRDVCLCGRNPEPHDRFPFFSSLLSVSGQAAPAVSPPLLRLSVFYFLQRDGHGRPMPERRRPRTRRRPDPLHDIPISPETCTKSNPAPAPSFARQQLCSPSASAASRPSGVQTPSLPSPSRPRPAPSLIQRPPPPFGPRPAALQPERFSRLAPKQRRGAPCHELLQSRQPAGQADPASFSLPSLAPAAPARQVAARARRWRTAPSPSPRQSATGRLPPAPPRFRLLAPVRRRLDLSSPATSPPRSSPSSAASSSEAAAARKGLANGSCDASPHYWARAARTPASLAPAVWTPAANGGADDACSAVEDGNG